MDTLRNQIVERKVIELIQSQAEFRDSALHAAEGRRRRGRPTRSPAPAADSIPEAEHDEASTPADCRTAEAAASQGNRCLHAPA